MRKIKPRGEYVLLEMVKVKDKTEGGLFIPDAALEKSVTAIVIEKGESDLVVGSEVMIERHNGGTEVKDGARTLLVVKKQYVMADVVEE